MARNLNEPAHWLAWLKACASDEWMSKQLKLPGPLAMLTGQDVRVLGAIAYCWHLYARADRDGQLGALQAIHALLPGLQFQSRGFARELVAQSMEWTDRERLWALVTSPSELLQ